MDIKVEDDVWIGYDCIILSGSVIGKGSVIGARSVVKGTIPPYSVYVGNKVIKRRFPDELINKIEGIDFSKIKHAKGDFYQQYCSSIVNDNNIEEVIDAFVK